MIKWFRQDRGTFKLLVLGFGVFVAAMGIWVGVHLYFSDGISKTHDIQELASRIEVLMLESRRSEKDFMLVDLSNPSFYQTGETINLQKHKSNLNELRKEIVALASILDGEKKETALELLRASDQYVDNFFKLVSAYQERGSKDAALESEWKDLVTTVEDNLTSNTPQFKLLLGLKRDEKDYLMQRQELTIDAVLADIEKLKKSASGYSAGSTRLLDDIAQYEAAFKNHVTINRKIGLSESMGLQSDMRDAAYAIVPLIKKVEDEAMATRTSADRTIDATFYVGLAAGIGLIGIALYGIYRRLIPATLPISTPDATTAPTAASAFQDIKLSIPQDGNGTSPPPSLLVMNTPIEANTAGELGSVMSEAALT